MKKLLSITLIIIVLTFTIGSNEVDAISIDIEQSNEINLNATDGFSNVVIFIKFADEISYEAPYELSYYENMFNGEDMVSLRDYYLEVSYNQLTIDSFLTSTDTEIIYYVDIYDRGYFEPYNETTNPIGYGSGIEVSESQREQELLKRAIDYVDANNLIDDTVMLDANDDGQIDSITFMVSGEDSGWSSLLWPHKWSLWYFQTMGYFDDDAPTINGYYAYDYTFELLGDDQYYDVQVNTYILAHETFHLLSATDLYHYYKQDYIDNVGPWGLMDNRGDVPPHMLGYMKEEYGNWINSVSEITRSGSYTLYPMDESPNNIYKIDTGYSNEYVYLEYRDRSGLYESNLPDSGLLVYRVDLDFEGDGNIFGYNEDDVSFSGINEVFVFRPKIKDVNEPIVFPLTTNNDDYDGFINQAALSNYNNYDEANTDSNFLMFHSDGSLMDIQILNVVEHDGYITFDVIKSGSVSIIDDNDNYIDYVNIIRDAYYYDRFEITNLNGLTAYYTIDGSDPDIYSNLYVEPVPFNQYTNIIKVAFYDGLNYITTITNEVEFIDSIYYESVGYINEETYYFKNSDYYESIEISFNSNSNLRDGLDFVTLEYNGITQTLTGNEIDNLVISGITTDLYVTINEDEENPMYMYDPLIDIYINKIYADSSSLSYEYNGYKIVTTSVFDEYTDPSITINDNSLTLVTINEVNPDVVGEYYIYYFIYDDLDNLVDFETRKVTVVDYDAPVLELIGDFEVNLQYGIDYFDDPGVIVTDNYDEDIQYDVYGTIDYTELGNYTILYRAVDSSGNSASIFRVIHIIDTTPPEVNLIGEEIEYAEYYSDYADLGVEYLDNYSTTANIDVSIEGEVNTEILGDYLITYIVTDELGNQTTISRTIKVIDTTPPEIWFSPSLDTVVIGSQPIELIDGVINYFDYDSEVNITITGYVDYTTAGTYDVTYQVTDSSLNISTFTKYIRVIEPIKSPVFDFGLGKLIYNLGEDLYLPSCTACEMDDSNLNSDIPGSYEINYSITTNGNTYSKTLLVIILDTTDNVVYYEKEKRDWL